MQNHNRLAAAGETNILTGKMPPPEQLYAMNMSEAEALGIMAVLQMGDADDAWTRENANQTLENDLTETKPYATSRPNYGKDQVEMVWKNAKDPVTGKVYDPSGTEIIWDRSKPRKGQWDMGHLPEEKYSVKHREYMEGRMSKEDFLAWYRDPNNYRPELPSTNRSHKCE